MKLRISLIASALLIACSLAQGANAPESSAVPSAASKNPTNSHPMAPEFGPSVVFDKADLAVQLSDLRGKMVLEIFYQSWCPICNGWSPELIKQVQTAFGNDPAVALVAIKVDGGTIAEAKDYLKTKNADMKKWIVGSDQGGVYYQRVSGGKALWGYALIDEEGRLVERGQAGMFYSNEATKRYVLGDPKIRQKVPNAAPFIADAASYSMEFKPIIHVAELGKYRMALSALRGYEHGKTKDEATKLHEAILTGLSARVEAWTTALKGTDATARYDAYRQLYALATMTDNAPGKAARTAILGLKTDKELNKTLLNEEHAESIFWSMIGKTTNMELDKRKEQLSAAMKQFVEAYPGTEYADRAAAESATISGGTVQ